MEVFKNPIGVIIQESLEGINKIPIQNETVSDEDSLENVLRKQPTFENETQKSLDDIQPAIILKKNNEEKYENSIGMTEHVKETSAISSTSNSVTNISERVVPHDVSGDYISDTQLNVEALNNQLGDQLGGGKECSDHTLKGSETISKSNIIEVLNDNELTSQKLGKNQSCENSENENSPNIEQEAQSATREKISNQLRSVVLSNIYVNNLYKYISKETVFKMLQYGEEIGLISCETKTVQSLAWKVKQLRLLKKELTGIIDTEDVGVKRTRFIKRKKKKTPLTVSQKRRLAKQRLMEFEGNSNSENLNGTKNALARALDLRVNYLENQDLDETDIDNELVCKDSITKEKNDNNTAIIKPRRGRKPKTKTLNNADHEKNEKRSSRGRTCKTEAAQRLKNDIDLDFDSDMEIENDKSRQPLVRNNNSEDSDVPVKRQNSYSQPKVSPSTKSKKKIKDMIEKFETIGLEQLSVKTLYSSLSKSQVTEFLEFGKRVQFINYDSIKQSVVWRFEQLKILHSKMVEYNQKVKQHEAEYKRMRRQDPEYRAKERQRNKEAKRKLRQDPEYRKQELINMTRARQLAKFRKLQLEFIEQEELMIEKRALESCEVAQQKEVRKKNLPMEPISISMEVLPVLNDTQNNLACEISTSAPACNTIINNNISHSFSATRNLNTNTGQFELLDHENSNTVTIQNNTNTQIHQLSPKEFMGSIHESNQQHHKESNYMNTGRENPHCAMIQSVPDQIMQRQQPHSDLIVSDSLSNEMRHPNQYENRTTQLVSSMHLTNRESHPHIMENNDYSLLARENVYHHDITQNKFSNRQNPHSAMADHNVSFTSLLINDQLMDCELHPDHE